MNIIIVYKQLIDPKFVVGKYYVHLIDLLYFIVI